MPANLRAKSVVAVLAVGATALISALALQLSGPPPQRAEASGQDPSETGGVDRLGGPTGSADGADSRQPTAAAPERTSRSPESIEELARSVPRGEPGEYAASHFGTPDYPTDAYRWVRKIIVRICDYDFFASPPYAAGFVFGESDRAWLQRVSNSVEAARRAHRSDDSPSGRKTLPLEVLNAIHRPYRKMIRDIAITRLRQAPALMRRFEDPRPLVELAHEAGSGAAGSQSRWLGTLLTRVAPFQLFRVGLNARKDLDRLSAADVPELARLRVDLYRATDLAWHDWNTVVSKEQTVALYRPFAERLSAILGARGGGGGGGRTTAGG